MIVLGLTGALALASDAQLAQSWQQFATADLHAIRKVMEENHPGPVDPENSAYGDRLKANFAPALARAAAARNFFDYKRAIRFYTNGFRDGHIVGYFVLDVAHFSWAPGYQWTGFSVQRGEDGRFAVSEVADGAPFKNGEELISCDGRPVEALMAERVDPFYWNADIPHERWHHLGRLFVRETGDEAAVLKSCKFRSGTAVHDVPIEWRPIDRERADQLRAPPESTARPSLRRVGDLWHVVLPTFHFPTVEEEAEMKALLAELRAKAPEMRRGRVLLDVRGNSGGSSTWASDVAAALWGEPWVERIANSFDWTVDWRASPENIAMLDRTVARFQRGGFTERAASMQQLRDAVAEAHRKGEPLARRASPGQSLTNPAPENPFTGRAYLLTDGTCASACLDFADVVRRLPNVTHIGWPTSADAVYIDNNNVRLPSGLAGFAYSMKVYRNRVRGNNEWYEPQVKWPGGPATDEAVVRWVAGLK